MPGKDRIEWRQPSETDHRRLAARTAQRDDGGQKAQGAEEGDQHADAGDQPELRHAGEVGRHEAEEARRRGDRCDQDLIAGADRVLPHRLGRIGIFEAPFAVAHGELDGEVHGDADEQDAEADRDQIEGADRGRGEQQRQHQAEREGSQDRQDQPPGLHGEEQPQRDQHHAADQAVDGAMHHGGELFVSQRHLPGDAHTCIA